MTRDDLAQRLANMVLNTFASKQYLNRLRVTFVLGVAQGHKLADLGELDADAYITEVGTLINSHR